MLEEIVACVCSDCFASQSFPQHTLNLQRALNMDSIYARIQRLYAAIYGSDCNEEGTFIKSEVDSELLCLKVRDGVKVKSRSRAANSKFKIHT